MCKSVVYSCRFIGILIFILISGTESWGKHRIPELKTSGADMNFYELYVDADTPDKVILYGETFLASMDSAFVHPVSAEMACRIADLYVSEKFFFSKALQWYEFALDQYTALRDRPEMVAEIQYQMAKAYYKLGQYHQTLNYSTLALESFRNLEDDIKVLDCCNLLGMVHHICRDFDKSREFFSRYVSGVKAHHDTTRLVLALNNAAVLENALSDTLKMRSLISESYGLSRQLNDSSVICQVALNASGIFMNLGMLHDARTYMGYARSMVTNLELKGCYYYYLALLSYLEKDLDASLENMQKAVSLYSEGEFPVKIQDCYGRMEYIYRMKGDSLHAYAALRKYYELENESRKNDVFIELFRAQNNILLQKDREEMLKSQNLNRMLWTVIIVAVLILLLLSYHFYVVKAEQIKIKEAELKNRQLMTEKSEQEVRSKNDLLELKKMQQYQIDRMNADIADKLVQINQEIKNPSVKGKVQQICRDLHASKSEDEWKEISTFVPEFNKEFFSHLVQDFPDLTVNERRLCALLNMNLSTKEISEITRQSPKSINVARTRLRNKLGLTGDSVSLQEFLSRYN